MFSYLHRYHAGNFADVHKHLCLLALLGHLHKKTTPFCVLDSHAGEGIYDLLSQEAQKNAEYQQGIGSLLTHTALPELVKTYVNIIHLQQKTLDTFLFPGSPKLIAHFLRPDDQAILIEQHPQALASLQAHFAKTKQIHIHGRDAWEGLVALVPFQPRRGLIFIDPPYEVKSDYTQVITVLKHIYPHFSHGLFLLWYPILSSGFEQRLIRELTQIPTINTIWQQQWQPYPNQSGLLASGIVLINPPWQCDQLLTQTFTWLNQHIYPQGRFAAQWLKRR